MNIGAVAKDGKPFGARLTVLGLSQSWKYRAAAIIVVYAIADASVLASPSATTHAPSRREPPTGCGVRMPYTRP